MKHFTRIIGLNQMAGPLFYETVVGISDYLNIPASIITGHPDTIKRNNKDIVIISAPIYNRGGLLHRLLSWIRYVAHCIKYIIPLGKLNLFIVSSNPPILGFVFWVMSQIRNYRYIMVVYDIYPEVLIQAGILPEMGLMVRLWRRLNFNLYRGAGAVITLGEAMADTIVQGTGINKNAIKVIYPWVDTDKIKPVNNKENPYFNIYNPENKFVILYSGNMGNSHDIDSILGAARLLKDHLNILFLFFGVGEKWKFSKNFIKEKKMENIKIYPLQPENVYPFTLSLADISIVSLEKVAGSLMIPSKVFYYMATGSAVIGLCDDKSDLSDRIIAENCGLSIQLGQPQLLADSIENLLLDNQLLQKFKINARNGAVNSYSKISGIKSLINASKSAWD